MHFETARSTDPAASPEETTDYPIVNRAQRATEASGIDNIVIISGDIPELATNVLTLSGLLAWPSDDDALAEKK